MGKETANNRFKKQLLKSNPWACECGYILDLPDDISGFSRYECPDCDRNIKPDIDEWLLNGK